MANEWTADPLEELKVPEDVRARQVYRFMIAAPISLSGTCADYSCDRHGVTLLDALIDTSERYQGTVLQKRITRRGRLHVFNAPLLVFSLNHDE